MRNVSELHFRLHYAHRDQEVRWTAAASAAAPPTLVEYDEERELRGHSAGLPRDLAHDTYIPPEVRFTGRQNIPPNHPPMPWNPKMVTPIWFQTRGPFEAPPDDPMEWARTGRRADAGNDTGDPFKGSLFSLYNFVYFYIDLFIAPTQI